MKCPRCGYDHFDQEEYEDEEGLEEEEEMIRQQEEEQEEQYYNMALNCKCGAYRVTEGGEVFKGSDCVCGAD